MTRAGMIVGFVSSLLGLIVGVATGVPEGKALAARLFALRTVAIQTELASFSATQFQHADPEHARQAVLSELRTLDSLEHLGPQAPRSPNNAALYIAYARLAMIEQDAGNAAAMQAAVAKAAEQWRILHPGEPLDTAQMKQAVHDFDTAAGRTRF